MSDIIEHDEPNFFFNGEFTTPSTEIKRLQSLKLMSQSIIDQTGTTLPDLPTRALCRSNVTNYEFQINELCAFSK